MNFNSKEYWEKRYKSGGNSGLGSYGPEADFKAKFINDVIIEQEIKSVNDLGCGDSNQISLLCDIEFEYNGYDVSPTVLNRCREKFKNDKRFSFFDDISKLSAKDLCLSLDVTYHIIEDNIYEDYMNNLFNLSNKFVLIYSVNSEDNSSVEEHLKYRKFVNWVEENKPDFQLISCSLFPGKFNVGFYLFKKI